MSTNSVGQMLSPKGCGLAKTTIRKAFVLCQSFSLMVSPIDSQLKCRFVVLFHKHHIWKCWQCWHESSCCSRSREVCDTCHGRSKDWINSLVLTFWTIKSKKQSGSFLFHEGRVEKKAQSAPISVRSAEPPVCGQKVWFLVSQTAGNLVPISSYFVQDRTVRTTNILSAESDPSLD